MVELISLLVGFLVLPLVVVVGLSYYALYQRGARDVSESGHYLNHDDIDEYRAERIREEESKNTEQAIENDNPVNEQVHSSGEKAT